MIGIVLINFGGPRSREDILPFLEDIFRDVLPKPLKFLVPFIARLRKPYAQKMYAAIGGASPVVSWTVKQAAMLEHHLCHCERSEAIPCTTLNTGDCHVALRAPRNDIKIYPGMKYGHPSIADAIEDAKEDGCEKIILLPLFPYQSRHTSMSLRAKRSNPVNAGDCFVACAPRNDTQFHTYPLYISAMVTIIKTKLAEWGDIPPPDIHFLFSVHAIPMHAAKHEPYLKQINESVSKIMEHFTGYNHHIAFQSAPFKFGWLGPDVKTVIRRIANLSTCQPVNLLTVPLGFACENIETLYEIDQVYIPFAKKLGFKNIARTPALNDHPQFIDLLAELTYQQCHPERSEGSPE